MTEPQHQPIAPRRKWMAIGIATVVLVVSYSAILVALVAGETEGGPSVGPTLAFGIGVVPFVFVVLAFLSGHPRPGAAVLKAMGLALLVAIPVSALFQDAISGLVAGYGAGGVVTLRSEEIHTRKSRVIAVALTTLYVAVLVRFVIEGGLIAGATLPLVSIGVADSFVEFRASRG